MIIAGSGRPRVQRRGAVHGRRVRERGRQRAGRRRASEQLRERGERDGAACWER